MQDKMQGGRVDHHRVVRALRDDAEPVLPLADAAAQLGMRPETLRKKCWRGEIAGVKRDGQWFVLAREVSQPTTAQDRPASNPAPDARPDVQDGMQDRVPDQRDPVQDRVQDDEIGIPALAWETLRTENDHLRQQLDQMHQRLAEAHLLLAQRPALPALSEPEVPPSDGATGSRPWWHALLWWRR